MSDKSRGHRRGCCAAIAICAAIVPAVADAQDAAIDRIEAIERKIHGLESELQRLKGELGEAKQQLRQSRSEALRAKEGARQAREAANRARQDAAKVVTIEAPATRPAPHAPAAPAAPPGCCRLGRHHGRHAARPADYRDRRWPDVVRNRRVVAVRYGRLLPKPAANHSISATPHRCKLASRQTLLYRQVRRLQGPSHAGLRRLARREPNSVRSEYQLHRDRAYHRHGRVFPSVRLVGGRHEPRRFAVSRAAQHHQRRAQRRGGHTASFPRRRRGDRRLLALRLSDRPSLWRSENLSAQ